MYILNHMANLHKVLLCKQLTLREEWGPCQEIGEILFLALDK